MRREILFSFVDVGACFKGDAGRLPGPKVCLLAGLLVSDTGVKGRWKSLCGDEARLPRRLLARLSGGPTSDTGVKGRSNPFEGDAGRLFGLLPFRPVVPSSGDSVRVGVSFGGHQPSVVQPVKGGDSVGPNVGVFPPVCFSRNSWLAEVSKGRLAAGRGLFDSQEEFERWEEIVDDVLLLLSDELLNIEDILFTDLSMAKVEWGVVRVVKEDFMI